MIVDCAPRGWLRLIEAENFKRDQLPLRDAPEARFPIEGVLSIDERNALIGDAVVRGLRCAPVIAEWQAAYRRIIDYAATKAGASLTANLP
ncbi:hypothetical protein C9413_18655 [Rhizobium sp. SEMIA 4085]|uniref:hypothetical protein n=1 Tax=Rhizobium gallicum TaxID=56730 RepID=UPI00058A0E01|nr:hypothetical protein [Rhizobium gallicum]NNH31447.1 hypothetical protein [Rhizobium sp. SEMIA 4085]